MLFSKAYQQLWLLVVTTFIESSHVLPIPLTLAPIRLVLAESSSPHGFNGNVMLRVHCQQALLLLMDKHKGTRTINSNTTADFHADYATLFVVLH
jgi:hypothetical protein